MSSIEERLAALEEAVSRLVEGGETSRPAPASADDPAFWLLEQLQRRAPQGAIAYGGHVDLPAGPVRWQMGADPHVLLESEWQQAASRLDALSHPVRLRLVQMVLSGTDTTAEMAKDDDLGTTGQLHHHLRQLVAAGWLASAGRGRYVVPAPRVVPLLLIVAAASE